MYKIVLKTHNGRALLAFIFFFIYNILGIRFKLAILAEVNKMAEGRCMKCKKSVEIKNPEDVVMKNGMKAIKGVCPVCGTKVFRIVGKAK